MKSAPSVFGQLFAMLLATALCVLIAFFGVKMAQSLMLAASSDDILLKAFETFIFMLLLGTLAMVFFGLVLRLVMPVDFSTKPFAASRMRELYRSFELAHVSVESDRDHAANPYRELPDLELCDVAVQVDQEAYPSVWLDVAHEIKNRVERDSPMRIG